jgi:hypothetical protein
MEVKFLLVFDKGILLGMARGGLRGIKGSHQSMLEIRTLKSIIHDYYTAGDYLIRI